MSDGLKRIGSKDGKIKWQARIVARHPDTGQKLIDTTRTVWAANKADALAAKDKLRTELVDKRLGRMQKARILFCDAADAWLETITRYGSQKTYRTHVKNLKLRFGPTWLDAIDVDDMQRHLAAMAKRFSPPVVGGHRTVLVNVWEWACDEGYLRRPNLAAQTRLRAAKKARPTGDAPDPDKRDMTPEELGRFMAALEQRDPIMAKLVLAMLVLWLDYQVPARRGCVLVGSDVAYVYGKQRCPHNAVVAPGRCISNGRMGQGRTEHPCPRDIDHVRWLVRWFSRPGETVLDPFCGSGTTLVAAKEHGRDAIGWDINNGYCKLARRSLSQAQLFAATETAPEPEQMALAD